SKSKGLVKRARRMATWPESGSLPGGRMQGLLALGAQNGRAGDRPDDDGVVPRHSDWQRILIQPLKWQLLRRFCNNLVAKLASDRAKSKGRRSDRSDGSDRSAACRALCEKGAGALPAPELLTLCLDPLRGYPLFALCPLPFGRLRFRR